MGWVASQFFLAQAHEGAQVEVVAVGVAAVVQLVEGVLPGGALESVGGFPKGPDGELAALPPSDIRNTVRAWHAVARMFHR
eukprot:8859443-Pyramimonas_sp.AAC.1